MRPIDGLPIGPGGVIDLGAIRARDATDSARPKLRAELAPTAEPCYRCPCCTAWNDALNTFRATVLAHDHNARRRRACPAGCQVCALAQGRYDADIDDPPPDDA